MTLTLAYDSALSRVRATGSGLPTGATTATLERSRDLIRWTTVRGALELALQDDGTGLATETALPADDYEFAADVANTYRLTTFDAGGVQLSQETAAITPTLGAPWLKVIAAPFLNRPVTVLDYSDVERPVRAGVHEIVGRSVPVVVADVRGSRRFELQLVTDDPTDARDLEAALAAGESVFLHVPAGCDVPAGYLHVAGVLIGRPSRRSARRVFTMPCTEIAAPAADVVGAVSTWQTVLNNYANWQDVISAHATWGDLLELIGTPEDVIVG